jgi:hypothetical protein
MDWLMFLTMLAERAVREVQLHDLRQIDDPRAQTLRRALERTTLRTSVFDSIRTGQSATWDGRRRRGVLG